MTTYRVGSGNFVENPQRAAEAGSQCVNKPYRNGMELGKGCSGRHFAPAIYISFLP